MASVAQLSNLVPPDALADLSELREIVRARSFKEGNFTLSSGEKSTLYFNMKPTMMIPRGAELAAEAFLDIISEHQIEYVGGLEMGAVPVVGSIAALSSVQKKSVATFFVRKRPKAHGTKDLIEGLGPSENLTGKRVLVIDDVATSGKSILQAIDAVRKAGGIVDHAACIVDREEGGLKLLLDHDVALHSVFTANEFLGAS